MVVTDALGVQRGLSLADLFTDLLQIDVQMPAENTNQSDITKEKE